MMDGVAVSIISHGHGEMVIGLVSQLLDCPEVSKIVITKNIYEELIFPESSKVQVIENKSPKGFGENHNYAFMGIKEEFFCPLNPDIRLLANPFPALIDDFRKYNSDLVAPLILNDFGSIEDSVRYFPTLPSLILKLTFKSRGNYSLSKKCCVFTPEWVAGMFMLFKSLSFKKLNGFNEEYFLYYEDVDICIRLWKRGMKIIFDPSVSVIHDARRASRKNFLHMKMHMKSMLRYFYSHLGRLPIIPVDNKNE